MTIRSKSIRAKDHQILIESCTDFLIECFEQILRKFMKSFIEGFNVEISGGIFEAMLQELKKPG